MKALHARVRAAVTLLVHYFGVILGVVVITFGIVRFIPGDPAQTIAGDYATVESIESIREKLGLDMSVWSQFTDYLGQLASGDLGTSLFTGSPVRTYLTSTLPFTIELAFAATLLSLVIGVPLGMLAAIKRDSWRGVAATVSSVAGVSVPVFWAGILAILVFSLKLDWFPATGVGRSGSVWRHLYLLVLPAASLSLFFIGFVARLSRATTMDVMNQDYIRAARAKGIAEFRVLWRHVLPNMIVPVVAAVGINFGQLMSGALLIEVVFSRPGVGLVLIRGLFSRDYPVVQGTVIAFAVVVLIANAAMDRLVQRIDPRAAA